METLMLVTTFFSLVTVCFLVGRRLLPAAEVSAPEPPSLFGPPPTFGELTTPLAGVLPVSKHQRSLISEDLMSAGDYRRIAVDDFFTYPGQETMQER